jgi:hypothetical protein
MDTLEQRVERLEQSCRRWRLGFLILLAIAAAGAAIDSEARDAQFANLTVQSLTIRNHSGGAFLTASCDADQASIKMVSADSRTLVALTAQKDSADLYLSRNTDKGSTSATLSSDNVSGLVNLRTADGKNKEIEPQ